MVKFISAEKTWPLRSEILRPGMDMESCIFPQDNAKGGFHLGYYIEDHLVGVASFFPSQNHKFKGVAYQLRGMAISNIHQGKGFGRKIIEFAKAQLHVTNARYVWCNARTSAKTFYENLGFKVVSDEFIIETVGPHFEMVLTLDNK